MPVVATVGGCAIRLYFRDHDPAHFHAVTADDEMLVRITDMTVIAGDLPPAQRRAVLTWAADHRAALAIAWLQCREGEKPGRIG
jgi:hypothetical protein